MNSVRNPVAVVASHRLETLLILAIGLLVAQLSWQRFVDWWQLPSPGTTGFDQYESSRMTRQYLIRLPSEYFHKDKWPLIVFLHGSGGRGTDPRKLREVGPLRKDLPAIVVVPQCLPSLMWESEPVARLIHNVASKYRVDSTRIYLIGFSMGASGVWKIAAANSSLFAAIVPISGGGDQEYAKTLVQVPVWAFHGASDKVVPLAESERMVEAIRDAGGQPKLTIIPDAPHAICNSVLDRKELWEWLYAQRRAQSTIVTVDGSP